MHYLWRPEDGVGSSGTVIINGSESPFVCCKSNPGPWEEKQVLLTTVLALVVWFFFFPSIHGLYVAQAGLQLMVSPLIPSAEIQSCATIPAVTIEFSTSSFPWPFHSFSPFKKLNWVPHRRHSGRCRYKESVHIPYFSVALLKHHDYMQAIEEVYSGLWFRGIRVHHDRKARMAAGTEAGLGSWEITSSDADSAH